MNEKYESQPEETFWNDIDLSQPEVFPPVPFADLTLEIPNSTPVMHHDAGINKAALNVHREKGLLSILRPYRFQAGGDHVTLHVGKTTPPVDFHTVTEHEALNGLQIPLYIPLPHLREGRVDDVYFKVVGVGGNQEETRHFSLLVDTKEPGGRDPIASTPHNENLPKPIFPQAIINNGVTEADAGRGVKVTIDKYPISTLLSDGQTSPPDGHERKAYDRIRLSIGGEYVFHTVTEGEAASGAPIDIFIYAGIWNKVGSGSHVCEYEVVDETGNYSLGWSPMQVISVFLKDSTPFLPSPYFEDVNADGDLDLEKLNGADATVVVSVRGRTEYQIGDEIHLRLEGWTHNGVIIPYFHVYKIQSLIKDARFTIPFSDLDPLAKGTVRSYYELYRTGVTPNRRSYVDVVNVIGPGNGIGLPPPIVLEAPDGNLPADILTVTVRISAYPGQIFNDAVTIILIGTSANGKGYYREIGPRAAGTGPITARITNGENGDIHNLEGGTLDICYLVTPENGASRFSESLHLDVGDNVASLRAPTVEEVGPPDFTFNPIVNLYDATVKILNDPAFILNSVVTFHVEGSKPGGSIKPIPFKITQNWVGKNLYSVIDRAIVLANIDGTMTCYYSLTTPNARTRFSHAFTMKVGAPLDLPVPEVLQATVITPGYSRMNPVHVLKPPVFTIRVRYNMQPGDQIQPNFKGKQGLGSPPIVPKMADPALGFVDFNVSNTAIAANLAGKTTVNYDVTRAGATTSSAPLTLEVQPLPDTLLDVVSIPEAVNSEIDANSYNSVLVREYPFMEEGYQLWIKLKGDQDLVLRDGDPISAAENSSKKIVEAIPADYLASLPNEDILKVEARVSLDGLGSWDSAVPFVIPPAYVIKKAVGVIGHIDVGAAPARLVVSPDGGRVYVANETSHTVSVISTASHTVIHTITGFNRPHAIAVSPDGGRLYVSNLGSQTVRVLNTSSFAEINSIPGFAAPYSIALNADGSRLYVCCYSSAALYAHETSTGTRVGTLSGYSYAAGLAFNARDTRLYVGAYNTVRVIDPPSHTQVLSISGFNIPRDMAYSPHNATSNPTLYVVNTSSNDIKIVNAGTNTIRNTLPGFKSPFGIAMHPRLPIAYITDFGNHSLKIVDTAEETVIDAITGFNSPFGVAISPNGSTLYVTNQGGASVTVIRT